MNDTKTFIILCLILFFTAIGCSDYMELAEKEYQAEMEMMNESNEQEVEEGDFLIYEKNKGIEDIETYKETPQSNKSVYDKKDNLLNEQDYSSIKKKDLTESTKEREASEEKRDSYWKRKQKMEQAK